MRHCLKGAIYYTYILYIFHIFKHTINIQQTNANAIYLSLWSLWSKPQKKRDWVKLNISSPRPPGFWLTHIPGPLTSAGPGEASEPRSRSRWWVVTTLRLPGQAGREYTRAHLTNTPLGMTKGLIKIHWCNKGVVYRQILQLWDEEIELEFTFLGQARIQEEESNKKDISVECLQISPDKFCSFNVSCLKANSQVQIPRIARVDGECGNKGGAHRKRPDRPCVRPYFQHQWSFQISLISSPLQIIFTMILVSAHARRKMWEQFQTQFIFNLCFITSHHKFILDEAMSEGEHTTRAPGRDPPGDKVIVSPDPEMAAVNH